jgi:ankyrin repeat protein
MLLTAGVNINQKASPVSSPFSPCLPNRADPLASLRRKKSLVIVRTLLLLQSGCTPLMYATKNGHTAVIRILVDAGADVNARDEVSHLAYMLLCVATVYIQPMPVGWVDGAYIRSERRERRGY